MASTTVAPGAASTSAPSIPPIDRIGAMAGEIWHFLKSNGPQSITKLINALDAPRDTILQALGWLAREDKISIEDDSRSRIVSLRQ
jgi:hypothetical protein